MMRKKKSEIEKFEEFALVFELAKWDKGKAMVKLNGMRSAAILHNDLLGAKRIEKIMEVL